MRRVPLETESQNYDSFLDIVANLVGILVILIMVIGVRAREVAESGPEPVAVPPPPPTAEISMTPIQQLQTPPVEHKNIALLKTQITEQQQQAQQINASAHEMNANLQEIQRMAHHQEAERNQLQMAISLAEKAIGLRRAKLGERQRVQLELAEQLQSGQHKLQQLQEQASTIETVTKAPEVLEHRPTPMAKTVFGKEEHFRITGGRITYVPLNEIVEMMRHDVKSKLWKLAEADEATETIGPVNGFFGKYTIERRRGFVQTPDGPRAASSVELRELDMVPETTTLGEPIQTAQQPESEFLQRIQFMNTDTTITLWVYPDGYADYRQIKSLLSQRNLTTAARVLQFGYLIGGAPNGTKSAAE